MVINHYDNYHKAKSSNAKLDPMPMFSPDWTSSLGNSFHWIGGWRPSMAFRLVYAKSGLMLHSELDGILHGLSSGNLADLSPEQLSSIDKLQMRTIEEERELTEKMAKLQETIADPPLVELAHVATENGNGDGLRESVDSVLDLKSNDLEEMLGKADDLRLRTLKAIAEVLGPLQAVDFLIAAAELHLRVHEWGKNRDENRREQE